MNGEKLMGYFGESLFVVLGLRTCKAKSYGCREQAFPPISAQNPACFGNVQTVTLGLPVGCVFGMSRGEPAKGTLNNNMSCSPSDNVKDSGQWLGATETEEEEHSRSQVGTGL